MIEDLFILSESDDFSACILELGGYQGINLTSSSTEVTVVRGIGFRGGAAAQGGGIYASVAWLRVENCHFDMNSATGGNGGGIYLYNGTYHVEDCMFTSNGARYGGGLYVEGSTIEIRRCEFYGNTAQSGAGISRIFWV